jgi:hypothetical protein
MMGNTMTAARRQRKPHSHGPENRRPSAWRQGTGLVLAVAMAAGLGLAGPLRATTIEKVVVDRHSGLAISGFDPVAYFTDAKALPGKGELEQEVGGVVWRFRSEGNRAAFVADPDVYRPRFGGFDPVGVARGVAVAGNPQLWAISDQRLYLFYSAETRTQFAGDRTRVITTADREWKSVQRMIVP